MSDRLSKISQQNYKPGHVLPVLPASELLASGRHQGLLQQVRELVDLDEAPYEGYYVTIVDRFAEFVQVLPSENNAALTGLLNESLARATVAFQYHLSEEDSKKRNPLLAYAIFTAGLLSDVNKVFINQKITLVDEEGDFQQVWDPFLGSMADCGAEFYKIYPRGPQYQRLNTSLTLLFAKQIMPDIGWSWLLSDPQIFAEWLDALRGDSDEDGRVGRALMLCRREDIYSLVGALAQVSVRQEESKATEHGETFYEWLKKGLANDSIKVNTPDAAVHVVEEGIFLERNKLYRQFTEVINVPVNMHVVFAQFGNLLGIAKKGGYDYVNGQYFSQYPGVNKTEGGFSSPLASRQRSLRDGMVLADPSMVFMNARIPAVTPMLKAMQPKGIEPPHPATNKTIEPKMV